MFGMHNVDYEIRMKGDDVCIIPVNNLLMIIVLVEIHLSGDISMQDWWIFWSGVVISSLIIILVIYYFVS